MNRTKVPLIILLLMIIVIAVLYFLDKANVLSIDDWFDWVFAITILITNVTALLIALKRKRPDAK